MSTLKVTNIQATGETASRAVSGVAAAWVNFNGTGTATITSSSNTSSLTDNGAGDYTLNFLNSFSSTDYAMTGAKAYEGSAYVNTNSWWVKPRISDDILTGSIRVFTGWTGASNSSQQDSEYNIVIAHGDLA